MRRRLVVVAALTVAVLGAGVSEARADVQDHCKTSNGWATWVDESDAVCGFALDAYRKARPYLRHVYPGERFRLNMGAGIVLRCRATRYHDDRVLRVRSDGVLVAVQTYAWEVECRERYHGGEVWFSRGMG